MPRHLILLCLIPLLALTACLETESVYTVNPDGSGKVTHSVKAIGMDKVFGTIGVDADRRETVAREAARRMIRGTQGIDTWTDVSYSLDEEGTLSFTGTAYFADLNKVKLSEADDRDPFPPLPEPTLSRTGEKLVLTIKQSTGDFGDLSSPEEPALSEAEIAARMEQQRREWDQAKLMLGELPDTLKMRIAINIPGTLENGATSNFKEVTPNQLALEISGKQMLNVLDELFEDDATARAIAEQGGTSYPLNFAKPPIDLDTLNERLFGSKGPIKASVVTDDKPLFDYADEVARAKAAGSPELENLQD